MGAARKVPVDVSMAEHAPPMFTVFTPTYNRRHTIDRVFNSLCAQTFRDFEWLVVDDGSTDGTEDLIASWAKQADFPIRYFRQPNSGKHIAYNLAVREARGQLFAPLDSDDAFLPDSLERLVRHWNAIPAAERPRYSGLGGLCSDQHGALIGDKFPASPFDGDMRDLHYVLRLRGEKWGVTRTDVLRNFPFPEIPGTQFVPEGIIGLQMAATYRRRYLNEVFRIYYVDEPESGDKLSHRTSLSRSARGRLFYYTWVLNHDLAYLWRAPVPFLKAALMLPVVARYAGRSFHEVWNELTDRRARTLVAMAFPFSALLALYYRAKAY